MSRVLLGWELGSNLGHVSRLLPLAKRLRARGHGVLAVVRDLALAASLLGPAGIPFIQAPRMSGVPKSPEEQASYADLLWQSGWADAAQLWALVQAWVNVFRMFGPDVAVFDHSPTALLAARCTRIRSGLIGTGFELPPLRQPLPTYPGCAGATLEKAARKEAEVLEHANLCLSAVHCAPLQSLCDLFRADRRWLTTFAELDHYGARVGEQYVGPIGEVPNGASIRWPAGSGHRVFAYLRPDMPSLRGVLGSLAASGAAVVCYGPGISNVQAGTLPNPRFAVTGRPVELAPLLRDASLCVSYAPAATVTETLLRGVPQLLAPAHVEAQMTAQRVESMGAGMVLHGEVSEQHVALTLHTLLNDSRFKARAAAFAQNHRGFDPGHVADNIVDEIQSLLAGRRPSGSGETARARV